MRITAFVVAGILSLGLFFATALHSAESVSKVAALEVVFTSDEVRLIRAYYEAQSRTDKSGNSKRAKKPKGLPPGIARNLARGKSLPPGIAKQTLPSVLHHSLPPVIDGHERIIVAGKILLVDIATQIVRDVLADVIMS